MIVVDVRERSERMTARVCEALPHRFAVVRFVRADDEVCVVAEDGACPDRVPSLLGDFREGASDLVALFFIAPKERTIQAIFCFSEEATQLIAGQA